MSVGCTGGDVTYNLKVDNSQVVRSISELNRLLTTYISLARRLGIEGDIITAIAAMQQLRIAIETTYRSLMLLYTTSGPVGWAIALGGIALGGAMAAGVVTNVADELELRSPEY